MLYWEVYIFLHELLVKGHHSPPLQLLTMQEWCPILLLLYHMNWPSSRSPPSTSPHWVEAETTVAMMMTFNMIPLLTICLKRCRETNFFPRIPYAGWALSLGRRGDSRGPMCRRAKIKYNIRCSGPWPMRRRLVHCTRASSCHIVDWD